MKLFICMQKYVLFTFTYLIGKYYSSYYNKHQSVQYYESNKYSAEVWVSCWHLGSVPWLHRCTDVLGGKLSFAHGAAIVSCSGGGLQWARKWADHMALDESDGAACLGSSVIDGLSLEVELKGHLESRSNLVCPDQKSAEQQACHRNHKAKGVPGLQAGYHPLWFGRGCWTAWGWDGVWWDISCWSLQLILYIQSLVSR